MEFKEIRGEQVSVFFGFSALLSLFLKLQEDSKQVKKQQKMNRK